MNVKNVGAKQSRHVQLHAETSSLSPLNAKNYLVFLNILSIFPLLTFELFQIRNIDTIPALFSRSDRFGDWVNTLFSSAYGNPYYPEGSAAIPCYGPFTYIVLKPLVLASQLLQSIMGVDSSKSIHLIGVLSWLMISILAVLITSILCLYASKTHDQKALDSANDLPSNMLAIFSFQFAFCSYPIVFAFDRGNIELITLVLVACYVCSHYRIPLLSQKAATALGVLALSVATSMKPYLLAYILFNKSTIEPRLSLHSSLRETSFVAIKVLIISVGITAISFATLADLGIPNIVDQFVDAQRSFFEVYTLNGAGDVFYLSPFILLKRIYLNLFAENSIDNLRSFYRLYFFVSLLGCVLLVASSRLFAFPPAWLRFILLLHIGLFLMAFPGGANEYKAVYIVLPLLICPPSLVIDRDTSPLALRFLQMAYLLALFICLNRYAFMWGTSIASPVSSAVIIVYIGFAAGLSLLFGKKLFLPSG
jgi:hypothetical protein